MSIQVRSGYVNPLTITKENELKLGRSPVQLPSRQQTGSVTQLQNQMLLMKSTGADSTGRSSEVQKKLEVELETVSAELRTAKAGCTQAVHLTISKEGMEQYRNSLMANMTGPSWEKINEEREALMNKKEVFGFNQINYSIGIHLGETNNLYTIGKDYAERYDRIVREHENGETSMIRDAETGEEREATLEEKLAALDRSFDFCLSFLEHCENQRPVLIRIEEENAAWYRNNGYTDLADEHEYRLEQLKQAPKLPEDFQNKMNRIREQWKAAYRVSSKDQAWEGMLKAIRACF